ncbi:hypothetical protein Pcinc_034544 [Petrolisthes cinctipes]|uniref:Transmembrane protein 223 n=1 Tax=Petrolisthes cinctipes TaxID=88211 RepID=A0AAE1BYE2_PETCI|nr:hypothetical protein Pcinc_034544 [Petrolisthes cinctipes]
MIGPSSSNKSKCSRVFGSLRLMVGQFSSSVSRSYSSYAYNSGRLRLIIGPSSSKSFNKSKFSRVFESLRLRVGQFSSSVRPYSNKSQRLMIGPSSSKSKFSRVFGSLRLMVGQFSSSVRPYSNNSQRLMIGPSSSKSKFSRVLGSLRLMVGQFSSSVRPYSNKSQRLMVLEQNYAVTKDTVLFRYDNARFFKLLNIFAISQFCFWSYLSNFAFVTMKNVKIPEEVKSDTKLVWWKKTNFGQFRYGITIFSFLIGWGTLAISWMYTIRCVRYLVLLQGGRQLTFVTFTPFGRTRQITVPLEKVSAVQSRMSVKTHLPLKVQGKSLHYLLDMRGKFTNTKLFDYSAGLKRSWAK